MDGPTPGPLQRPLQVGIDLGTTYCCMAYVDDEGRARVIRATGGAETTPSVVWFDGTKAFVGARANQLKLTSGEHIYEFVKRDMGRPVEPAGGVPADEAAAQAAPYQVGGFKYGAAGISALILRKLKKEAVAHFKRLGRLDPTTDERQIELDAVITVPAYFGDRERQETRLAGYAAGLNVTALVNEPTAAAVSYGLTHRANARLLVFDLGGGTLDVTVLRVVDGDLRVAGSVGNSALGGRDWDALIEGYIHEIFRKRNGRPIPDDPQRAFEVQELALRAKHALSAAPEHEIFYSIEEGEISETLYREAPAARSPLDRLRMPGAAGGGTGDAPAGAAGDMFYFDRRAASLLSQCRTLCENALVERLPDGGRRQLGWADIDEVVLAGGSCRMPMIPAMLEELTKRRVRRHVEGFDYDTAIAMGAALYGRHRARVTDVVSHGLGVRLKRGSRFHVEYLIEKDVPLPAEAEQVFAADAAARLDVYEGESADPDECVARGQLRLDNPDGRVGIRFRVDRSGLLKVTATYSSDGDAAGAGAPAGGPPGNGGAPGAANGMVTRELRIENDAYLNDARARQLRERVQAVSLNV